MNDYFNQRRDDVQDSIKLALDQGDYLCAAGIALGETELLNGDGTPYFHQRGLAYSILALAHEMRKR